MTELIPSINEVVQYGLQPNLNNIDKERNLEQSLVNIYHSYFEYNYEFDQNEYADFDKSEFNFVPENIKSNFPKFGFYNVVLNLNEVTTSENNMALGDAIDNLIDIIFDLLEIKWRLENNSYDDGIWFLNSFLNRIPNSI